MMDSQRASQLDQVKDAEQEYERLVELLDELIDEVGEDETDPLASLMEVIRCHARK